MQLNYDVSAFPPINLTQLIDDKMLRAVRDPGILLLDSL